MHHSRARFFRVPLVLLFSPDGRYCTLCVKETHKKRRAVPTVPFLLYAVQRPGRVGPLPRGLLAIGKMATPSVSGDWTEAVEGCLIAPGNVVASATQLPANVDVERGGGGYTLRAPAQQVWPHGVSFSAPLCISPWWIAVLQQTPGPRTRARSRARALRARTRRFTLASGARAACLALVPAHRDVGGAPRRVVGTLGGCPEPPPVPRHSHGH